MEVQKSNIRRVQSGKKACRLFIGFALANVSEYGPGSEIWGRGVFPFTKSAGLLTPYCLLGTSEGDYSCKAAARPSTPVESKQRSGESCIDNRFQRGRIRHIGPELLCLSPEG
jgi:hypothetical protein